jgi:hypothetical protein
MKSRLFFILALGGLALAFSCASARSPFIEFTYVPPYGSSYDLEGRVRNVNPADYKVAVYIFVEGAGWWTKPTSANPLTSIQSDSTWICDITTGGSDIYATKIHAFLLPNGVDPPLAGGLPALPETLYTISVANVYTIRSPKTISFSGYEWWVKASVGQVGPGPNYFSDSTENVWVDGQGQLHLKITQRNGKWYCPEVICKNSFGYGKYIFYVTGRIGQLDKNVVLGLFTWDDSPEESNREIDIEFSRWGTEADTNAQYVLQPWDQLGNRHRWMMPELVDSSSHSFDWKPDSIYFFSVKGHLSVPLFDSLIHSWVYKGSNIPTHGNENARINLWLFNGSAPADTNRLEVVISRFEYYPDTSEVVEYEVSVTNIPSGYVLYQNYPNPFNPTTKIRFTLPKSSYVTLKVFNLLGQEIEALVSGKHGAGEYEVEWKAKSYASGVYLCRLQAGKVVETKKLVLLK